MLAPLWLLALAMIGVVAVWTGDALLTLAVALAVLVSLSLLLWQHFCLVGVSYRRRLSANRAVFDETIELTTELINLKPLPLTWLQVDDVLPRGLRIDGVTVRAGRTDLIHRLTIIVAMLPYQRVVRRMQVRCTRRGELVFGPASLASGDYLGTLAKHERQSGLDHLIVYPKIFRVVLGRLPSNRILGRDAALRNLLTDPIRTIGTREYTPGDPYRSIDWRASARSDTLMVRVSEPSTTPILDIVLNFQTATSGWDSWENDGVEFAISVAASLAAYGTERGWAIGMRGNGYSGSMPIDIRPSASPEQFRTVLETLACASIAAHSLLSSMLAAHDANVPAGATLLLITTMLDAALCATLRDVQRRGRAVLVLQIARDHDVSSVDRIPILRIPYDQHWTEHEALVLGQ
jgi:uncharacterized repeat protein (TIGR01451 family)